MRDVLTERVYYSLHSSWLQALTLYLVWDEEAELSEEDTVLTSLLTGSDEDSEAAEAEVPKKPKKAGKVKKQQSEADQTDDDDDSEDSEGVVLSSELQCLVQPPQKCRL